MTSNTFLYLFFASREKVNIPQQPRPGSQGDSGVSGFTGLTEVHPGWKVFGVGDKQPALPSGAPKANVIPPFVLLS